MNLVSELKKQLSKEFEMKDFGAARKILGVEISRDRSKGILTLSQKGYIQKVLEKFHMKEAKIVSTPTASHFKLSSAQSPKTGEEMKSMESTPYASAVGSLMYAMVSTRPDLAYAVSLVSRFMHNAGKEHWNAVKWILRYLKGTSNYALVFDKNKANCTEIRGFVDSDFAGDLDKRKSIFGYIFTVCGAPISWAATLQSTIALSSTEAEYISTTEGIKEASWLHGLAAELGLKQEKLSVFCDNQSRIYLAKNGGYHGKTKHIEVKYHFIRHVIEEGSITLQKIHTSQNPADMLTKTLQATRFNYCQNLAGIYPT